VGAYHRNPDKATISSQMAKPPKRIRNCRCGMCELCLENARWDRIYRSKFEDPDYYGDHEVPHPSPLSDIAKQA
jgi:hypothetical protein